MTKMTSSNCYKLIIATYFIASFINKSLAIQPRLKADPSRTVWIEGEKCNKLVCETTSNSIPTQQCVWQKNGNNYTPLREPKCDNNRKKFEEQKYCTLSFFNLNVNITGSYSCGAIGNSIYSNAVEILIQKCPAFIYPKFEINVSGTSAHVKVKDNSLNLARLEKYCVQTYLTNATTNEIVRPNKKLKVFELWFHGLLSGGDYRVVFEFCDCEPLLDGYSVSKKFKVYNIAAECIKTDTAFEVSVNPPMPTESSNQTSQYYFNHVGSSSSMNITSYSGSPVSDKDGGFFRYFQKYNLTLHRHFVDIASSDLFNLTTSTQFACPSKYYDNKVLHIEAKAATNLKMSVRNSQGELFADDPSVDVLVSMYTDGTKFYARKNTSNLTVSHLLPGTSYKASARFCLRQDFSHTDELCSDSCTPIMVQTLNLETVTTTSYENNNQTIVNKNNPTSQNDNTDTDLIITYVLPVGVAVGFSVLILILIAVYVNKKRSSRDSNEHLTVVYNANGRDNSEPNCYYTPMDPQAKSAAKLVADRRESLANNNLLIKESELTVGKEIGEGQFGTVHEGLLRRERDNATVKVAVKFTKANDMTLQEKIDFLKEAQRMEALHHCNVMRLIGIYMLPFQTVSHFNPGVVLPFMEHGDLKTYLVAKRLSGKVSEFTLQDLLHYSVNVARGMNYLEEQNIVHRDLAARNCMLDGHYNVVVSDFGLARSLYSRDYYRQSVTTRLPIKWMAMESLTDNIFSPKTDVWSYGVTVWEILSLGQQPYAGLSNGDMQNFLHRGKRLERPGCCPNNIWFNVIYRCWYAQAAERLSFAQIIDHLEEEITELGEDALVNPLHFSYPVASSSGYEEVNTHLQGYNLAEDSEDELFNPPSNAPLLELYDDGPINL